MVFIEDSSSASVYKRSLLSQYRTDKMQTKLDRIDRSKLGGFAILPALFLWSQRHGSRFLCMLENIEYVGLSLSVLIL